MNRDCIRQDLEYLAGSLHHRDANTEQERAAAEYLFERFKEYTLDTEVDDFESIESPWFLFASYYAEFLFVAVIANWWPWVAFTYGAVVFVSYVAEFTGYRVFARLLPRYQSQNVVARFLSTNPERLFVVSAHYDSARECLLNHPSVMRWLRPASIAVLCCMTAILASCALQAAGLFETSFYRYDLVLRWGSVIVLLAAAAILVFCEISTETGRGANDNASGVAALLALAERVREQPFDDADVWLVATGSSETWMSGMHHFVTSHQLDRSATWFIDLDRVGAGKLRYVTGEGLVQTFHSAPELVRAAERAATPFAAKPCRRRGLPSDALIPHIRGFKALSVTSEDGNDREQEPVIERTSDVLAHLERDSIERAACYAQGILRVLKSGPER